MKEVSPCKDCPNRTPGCHDSCDKYKLWRDMYQAQVKELKETGNRWLRPWSPSHEKYYRKENRFLRYNY